mgnify:CR=1 FL=1
MTETSLSAAAQLYNYKCIGVTIKDYDIILFIGHLIRRVIFFDNYECKRRSVEKADKDFNVITVH